MRAHWRQLCLDHVWAPARGDGCRALAERSHEGVRDPHRPLAEQAESQTGLSRSVAPTRELHLLDELAAREQRLVGPWFVVTPEVDEPDLPAFGEGSEDARDRLGCAVWRVEARRKWCQHEEAPGRRRPSAHGPEGAAER